MTSIPHRFLPSGDDRRNTTGGAAALFRRHRAKLAAVLVAGVIAYGAKGIGLRGKVATLVKTDVAAAGYVITVSSGAPADGAFNVPVDAVATAELKLPNGGLDVSSVNPRSVLLVRTRDQKPVPATVKVTGSRTLSVRPDKPLAPATNYTFIVTGNVRHRSGAAVLPYATSFTTAGAPDSAIQFEKVELPTATGTAFTCLRMGPDGKLWAGSDDGRIFQFPVKHDGTLGEPRVLKSLQTYNNGPRLLIGFAFDPRSTAAHPVLWATNNAYTFNNAPDFSGKVTRLAGPDLEDVGDVVVSLPRSIRDHMTNQPDFGPDGALYFPQGSSSSYGAPDEIWGWRIEHRLTATILRLDVDRVVPGKPVDALTSDVGGHYDPQAPDAPLSIFATGVRNAYDCVWHSNGRLYVPTNGSSAGGNAPAGAAAPPIKDLTTAEDDWLFRIAPGKYHGHPNPFQGHYVLNGGNPTADYDFAEAVQYPVGVQPDPNYERPVYSFGKHTSANGVIEYQSDVFGGRLKNKLMVCRYNVGADIIVLSLDAGGNVTGEQFNIPGLNQLTNALDLTHDPRSGNIYVTELGAMRLTLMRPITAPPMMADTAAAPEAE